ncbi:MAG TPA: hypothetical protein VKX17_24165 [Planctomycetota bacterium]|nr:hypothetical protein [Planctomycetota bacterium]
MHLTQNLRFQARENPNEPVGECGPGGAVMRALSAGLSARAWETSALECWRDGGWVVFCKRENSELQIILSATQDGEWSLQIAPKKSSLFGRSGQRPSASPTDVHRLALDVHALLEKDVTFALPRWCWDDFPDSKNSSPAPRAANS